MSTPTTETLKAAAHDYARRGWRVIPVHHVNSAGVCSCKEGAACRSAGKHPTPKKWQERASRSGADIETWWDERPRANVGIATGADSGLFVFDIDPDSGGFETLAALEAEHGGLPRTRTVRTGSGGTHYYFTWPDFAVTNSAKKLGPGLDIRGNGGQVVAPPSRSAKGDYALEVDAPVVDAPAWLLDMLRPPERPAPPSGLPASTEVANHYAAKALESELAALRSTKTGRNDQLNRSAFALGQLVAVGALDAQRVRVELTAASVANGYVAKDGIHAMHATLESGLSKGMANPRTPWPPVSSGGLSAEEIDAICATYDVGDAFREWLLGGDAELEVADVGATPAAPRQAHATAEELDDWVATFVSHHTPGRLRKRAEWMRTGNLHAHAKALVTDSIAGHYPARQAAIELHRAYKARGGTDPKAVSKLLAAALGTVLNSKVGAR